jgi:tetratricopeptide (TPR) repeat protein
MSALLLAGCEPEKVREEKTLRSQLEHELRSGAFESAVPLARRLVQEQPQDNNAWRELVQAQLSLHDPEGAQQTLTAWRSTVKPPPNDLDEFEGDIAREEHETEGALRAWRKAAVVLTGADRARVFEKIGQAEQTAQHWTEAADAWGEAIKAQDSAVCRINRAVCERRLRRWDDAFHDFRTAQHLGADEPDVQKWSATFENLGKYLDEIRELDAKLAALPGNPNLLGDRALLLMRSGDPELALDDAETAARLASWAVRPKLLQALALIALQRTKESERLSIRQPLRMEALTPEFLESISRLDTAISVERKNPDHYAVRAWQLNEIGQPLLGLQDAETAVRLDPKSAGAYMELSYALSKLGRGDEARDAVKMATDLDAKLAPAWLYRGELEMERANNLAAIEFLSKAIAIETSAAALEKREECYRRVGLLARAADDHRAREALNAQTVR